MKILILKGKNALLIPHMVYGYINKNGGMFKDMTTCLDSIQSLRGNGVFIGLHYPGKCFEEYEHYQHCKR